ncbi:MAG: hypothetical protein LW853_03030, partial [Rickettsiales bacterium]|nr:hypothetical protein [Rickettsiales bacterium]
MVVSLTVSAAFFFLSFPRKRESSSRFPMKLRYHMLTHLDYASSGMTKKKHLALNFTKIGNFSTYFAHA